MREWGMTKSYTHFFLDWQCWRYVIISILIPCRQGPVWRMSVSMLLLWPNYHLLVYLRWSDDFELKMHLQQWHLLVLFSLSLQYQVFWIFLSLAAPHAKQRDEEQSYLWATFLRHIPYLTGYLPILVELVEGVWEIFFPGLFMILFSHLWWFGVFGLGFSVDGVLGLCC